MAVGALSNRNVLTAIAIPVAGAPGFLRLRRVGDIANARRHPSQ
jgi:hypothetical protein